MFGRVLNFHLNDLNFDENDVLFKFSFLVKIPKLRLLAMILMLDQNSDFWPEFWFLTKIPIFDENSDFSPELLFFTKIPIFPRISIFTKIPILTMISISESKILTQSFKVETFNPKYFELWI